MLKETNGLRSLGTLGTLDTLDTFTLSTEFESTSPLINLLERWKAEGFIGNIPDEAPGAHENQPVKITGKPVSEIILENRGPK